MKKHIYTILLLGLLVFLGFNFTKILVIILLGILAIIVAMWIYFIFYTIIQMILDEF